MEELFEMIKSAFGALWKCRPRGSGIEVITPFATSTEMYVSVFISRRGDAWVVSDGGWTHDGVYYSPLPLNDQIFSRILAAFKDNYGISETVAPSGSIFYYKSTKRREMVANIVFDLGSFISQTVSAATVQYRELSDPNVFRKKVRGFLSQQIEGEDMRCDTYVTKESSDARFNFIIDNRKQGLSLINLVSGQNPYVFRNSFGRSNLNYQLLAQTAANRMVKNRIVMIDDSVFPMDSDEVGPLVRVASHNGQIPMSWSTSKERLLELIA